MRIAESPPTQPSPVFASTGAGLRFVYGNQLILGAQALNMFAMLFGRAMTLAVVAATAYLAPGLRKLNLQHLH